MTEFEEIDEDTMDKPSTSKPPTKGPKRGILYLSTIPPYMNVSKIREVFGEYGTVGRVYLQLADTEPKEGEKKKKRKPAKKFTEGWVEFERKSVAKRVAQMLNNVQVSTRKSSKHYDVMWNIKYLSNFKWTHLHERLAYEKAARRQKLRAEIQLAKKKTNYFTINLDKHKKKKPFVNKDLQSAKSKNVEDQMDESGGGDEVERTDFLQSLFK